MRKSLSAREVVKRADEMDARRQEQIKRQGERITSFMAYLEQTDQVSTFVAWEAKKRLEAKA